MMVLSQILTVISDNAEKTRTSGLSSEFCVFSECKEN